MLVGTSAIDSSRLRALTTMVSMGPEPSLAACSWALAGAPAPRLTAPSAARLPPYRPLTTVIDFMLKLPCIGRFGIERSRSAGRGARGRRGQESIDEPGAGRRVLPEGVVAQPVQDLHLRLRQGLDQGLAHFFLHDRVLAAPDQK